MTFAHTELGHFIIAMLLGGVAVMLVAWLVPNFEVRGGFGASIVVGLVYGLLKMFLQKLLITLALPVVLITFGLFIFVINAFLLWLTDKLLERFEVRTKGALLVGALLLSAFDIAFRIFLHHGTLL